MRTLATLSLAALAALALSSCNCGSNCNGYDPSYLRDVPTEHVQYFY